MKAFIFLATGFEETEALATLDVLRRGGIDAASVSIMPEKEVRGAHGITAVADVLFKDADFAAADILVLPGGMPGAANLQEHKKLGNLLTSFAEKKNRIAAICAAPKVLGNLGILKGYNATCYPGFENELTGAEVKKDAVVVDRNIITAKGPAFAIPFGLKIIELLKGKDAASEVADGMLWNR